MSWLVILAASSRVIPLTISVRADEEAMALAQPKVWNLASLISVLVQLEGELQGVAAGDGAHLGDAVRVLHFADIPGMEEMFHDFSVYSHIDASFLWTDARIGSWPFRGSTAFTKKYTPLLNFAPVADQAGLKFWAIPHGTL